MFADSLASMMQILYWESLMQGNSICIPTNYSKFDLPNETQTTVSVGIDIKDIPKIDDKAEMETGFYGYLIWFDLIWIFNMKPTFIVIPWVWAQK